MDKENIRLLNLFCVSVKKDLELWSDDYFDNCYKSPFYGDFRFELYYDKNEIKLFNKDDNNREIIFKYRLFSYIKYWDVCKTFTGVTYYFRNIESIKKKKQKKVFISNGLSKLEKEFPQEIRKEKLKKLS